MSRQIPRFPGLFDNVSLVTSWPPLHINPREIEDLILIHGSSGELRRGQVCPCARLETGQANANCPVCHGIGHVYPVPKREPLVFLDHSRTTSAKHQGPGYLSDGTIAVTVPGRVIPAKYDLILPDDDVAVVHETFHRDVQQVARQTLADRAIVDQRPIRLRPRAARLLYPTVTEIEALYWLQGDRLAEARPGSDYRLAADGLIEWLDGAGPGPGEGFTVRYRAPAAYLVHAAVPLFRHEADRGAPYSVQATRIDKVQRDADLR